MIQFLWRGSLIFVTVCTVVLIPNYSPAQVTHQDEIHTEHFLRGSPTGDASTNDLIVRSIYVLSNNDSTKFADWVAYQIDSSTVQGDSPDRDWRSDPWLERDETLEPSDYDSAFAVLGTHRGHQAPLAAFRGTGLAEETNYLSNVTPQMGELNGGPWAQLENAIRSLAEDEVVYVLTGPLYERSMPSLPKADEPHRIPSAYWKIAATPTESSISWAAFIMDQSLDADLDYCEQRVSINDVEARASLDLFHELDDTIEERIESTRGADSLLALDCGVRD